MRYPLSPSRSRYRLQNGKVPKLLLIVFRSDFAVSLRRPVALYSFLRA